MLWNPSGDGSQVVSVCEQHLELWDLDRSASTAEVSLYCMHCTGHEDAENKTGEVPMSLK